MRRIQEKLGSRKGASITFALLLFLVCAVASSVVIVAGSTAAGRMSEQARTDQRYYAVASAVELLRDDFSNKTVAVPYTVPDKTPSFQDSAVTVSSTDPKKTLTAQYPLVIDVTKELIKSIVAKKDSDEAFSSLALKAESAPEGVALDCDIEAYVKRDGRAIFQVSNNTTAEEDKNKKSTLTVTFMATISESKTRVGDETTYTTTVEWRPGDIRKGAIEEGG